MSKAETKRLIIEQGHDLDESKSRWQCVACRQGWLPEKPQEWLKLRQYPGRPIPKPASVTRPPEAKASKPEGVRIGRLKSMIAMSSGTTAVPFGAGNVQPTAPRKR